MSKPVPQSTVIRSFFWPQSAEHVAHYLRSCGFIISPASLRDRWTEEMAWNTVMRQFAEQYGDRPVGGYSPSDALSLAENLAAMPYEGASAAPKITSHMHHGGAQ
jgi:hypothetical protein